MSTDEYLELNKKRWNELVDHHSKDYSNLDKFNQGESVLNSLELELLGDLSGKKVLHLQCHFGLDTISLLREGAEEVVGVDFSEKAIAIAREIADELGVNARFIQSDVLKLDDHLDEFGSFDIVFTSYGTIVWLPELNNWGRNIATYLKSGGKFVFVDAHPFSHIFDDEDKTSTLVPRYPYFIEGQVQHYEVEGSYATSAEITNKDEYLWPHTLSEICNSLSDNNLTIKEMHEYKTVNWKMFPFLEQGDDGWYYFPDEVNPKIPLLLGIVALR